MISKTISINIFSVRRTKPKQISIMFVICSYLRILADNVVFFHEFSPKKMHLSRSFICGAIPNLNFTLDKSNGAIKEKRAGSQVNPMMPAGLSDDFSLKCLYKIWKKNHRIFLIKLVTRLAITLFCFKIDVVAVWLLISQIWDLEVD